jgi:hypothetical protein
MQKWQYAHAIYNGVELDPHAEMNGMVPGSLGPFLHDAGEKGWEMCGVLPYPTSGKTDVTVAVIFKRPIEDAD